MLQYSLMVFVPFTPIKQEIAATGWGVNCNVQTGHGTSFTKNGLPEA